MRKLAFVPLEKKCGSCAAILPLSSFYKHANRPDGHEWSCKACRKKRRKPGSWKAHYAKHREEIIARVQAIHAARYAAHPEERRAIKARYYAKLRRRVVAHLGSVCRHCGFSDPRALQFDHVGGGGSKERKTLNGDRLLLAVLRDESGKYQLLCANCNWIKRHGNPGENPGFDHPTD